ncbi:procollagen galactosyltransferase 1-like [Onychostruthus taczanowskii]|uniref:procollagen galactosyltransferase 1-like n=1 Tax=Onychostruthus taczanowskii TaxID=356909 RepID=UPI001B8036C7|nr:procollagen galactosyltransferase 1-like [Onychostruthus taczanowskii]
MSHVPPSQFLDADNVLVNPDTLAVLVAENRTVVAPMLDSRAAYSNFWCGITPQGYYRRTPAYLPIRRRERRGCFAVPMVHSTFLLDLRRERSQSLAFHPPPPGYSGAFDDIIVFAAACRHAGVQMFVSNREQFGFLPVPLRSQSSLRDEAENFLHVQLEIMVKLPPAEPSPHVWVPPKVLDKLGFDEVGAPPSEFRPGSPSPLGLGSFPTFPLAFWVIFLLFLGILGHFPPFPWHFGLGIWGGNLGMWGVRKDPGGPGDSGFWGNLGNSKGAAASSATSGSGRREFQRSCCFLSHFRVWQEISARGLRRSLVFEDDLRFEVFFRSRLTELMEQLDAAAIDWDLM